MAVKISGMMGTGSMGHNNRKFITENLYADLPDAPTGSYLGSMGLPVATGEIKISISAWVSDLYLHNSRYRAAPDCRCRRYEGLSAYRFSRFRRRWAG